MIYRLFVGSSVFGKVANMTNRRFETEFCWYLAAEKRGRQKRSSQEGERRDLGQGED